MRYVNVGSKSVCEVNHTIADKTIRLDGSITQYTGVIEVFHKNQWGAICFNNFSDAEGHVACRDVGYSGIFGHAVARWVYNK